MLIVFCISMGGYIFYTLGNTVVFLNSGKDPSMEIALAGFATNFIVVIAFMFYSIIVLGTLINRFTDRVKCKKINSYLFYPSVIISFVFVFVASSLLRCRSSQSRGRVANPKRLGERDLLLQPRFLLLRSHFPEKLLPRLSGLAGRQWESQEVRGASPNALL